jgi:recombination endonuclease VII
MPPIPAQASCLILVGCDCTLVGRAGKRRPVPGSGRGGTPAAGTGRRPDAHPRAPDGRFAGKPVCGPRDVRRGVWLANAHEAAGCELGDGPLTGKGGPRLDHDQTAGTVSGLLCSRCKRALGPLGDTPKSLERAIKYLRAAHETEPSKPDR